MNSKKTLRQIGIAVLLLVTFLVQGTWALAGTTGGLYGTVTDTKAAPVAGATVTAASPSGTSTTTTDASGTFRFLSLTPDTYTVSVDKSGFSPASQAGVSVFADNQQAVNFRMSSLKEIGSVTSRSSNNYVKSGTTNDVYSVNAATQEALQGLGGGGNLNSAYSAVYGTPGVTSYTGNYGFGQVFYIRGGSYDQSGYEYDGVPVNRAFDNYNSNSLSTLGQQELQVYAGSSPSGAASATQVGFINQVIRTGTYPGFGNLGFGLGAPAFYHEAKGEAGGATPNRLFSYYVGVEGVNQQYNILNNQNGGNISTNGNSSYGFTSPNYNPIVGLNSNFYNNGPYSACTTPGVAPTGAAQFQGINNCTTFVPYSGLYNDQNNDREFVTNFHFGIPHKRDSGRDDVQLLLYSFGYRAKVASSINKTFGSYANLNNGFAGSAAEVTPYTGFATYPGQTSAYPDLCAALFLNAYFGINHGETCATTVGAPGANPAGPPLPFTDGFIMPPGTSFLQPAAGTASQPYLFPNSPQNRSFRSGLDPNYSDGIWNDGSVIKLQYQKNISSNSYLRLLGYTFYSDWLHNAASTGSNAYNLAFAPTTFYSDPDYELNTHTRGVELQYSNQINTQNLLTFSANYTTASSLRWNNTSGGPNWLQGAGSTVANLTDGTNCYSAVSGNAASCYSGSTTGRYANPVSTCTSGSNGCAISGTLLTSPTGTPCAPRTSTNVRTGVTTPLAPLAPGTPACLAGAQYAITVPGNSGGYLNTVVPKFTSMALEDQFRPNDRLNLNVGVRLESYTYDLRSTNNPEYNFWYAQAQKSYCVDPGTGLPMFNPTSPTTPPGSLTPVIAFGATPCPTAPSGVAGAHPDGTTPGVPLLSGVSPTSLTHGLLSPRVSGTYTLNPDTVLRFSAGKFSQPTPAAFEQYTFGSGRIAPTQSFQKFYGLGYNTPVHDNPLQVSANYDFSYERHFKGTDMSMKLTPFFRYSQNQSVLVPLGPNFVSAVNVGTQKTTGVELAFQKGDPSREGLSGQLAVTYVNALIKYNQIGNAPTVVDLLNNYIRTYNGLTSFCATAGATQASTGPHDQTHLCPAGNGTTSNAAPCYTNTGGAAPTGGPGGASGLPAPCNATAVDAGGNPVGTVNNPYYTAPVQALLDRNGFYPTYPNNPPGDPYSGVNTALGPLEISGYLSWKHQKLSITPNFVLAEGNKYGSPTSIIGVDPRNCASNQVQSGAVAGGATAGNCDYQTANFSPYAPSGNLAIPNPYSGKFDNMGQYRNPWQLNIGAQLKYEVSPKMTATLLLANLFNRCMGGDSTPWSSAFAPSNYVCGYGDNTGAFIGTKPGSGFFNGANGADPANGTAGYPKNYNYPYSPYSGALPFQAYLLVNFKL